MNFLAIFKFIIFVICLQIFILFGAVNAQAQDVTAQNATTDQVSNWQIQSLPKATPAFQSSVELKSYNYSYKYDPANSENASNQENIFHVGLLADTQIEKNHFYAQAVYDTDLNRSKNNSLAVPTLGLKIPIFKKSDTLSIGRTVQWTSHIDQQFHLGLVHPYYTLDNLNYSTQGLTGFEFTHEGQSVSFLAGYYPLFLPNQEPSVVFKNSQAITQNRWSKQPPSFFGFGDQKKNIDYDLQSYDQSEIIKNSSVRAGIKFSDDNSELTLGYKRGPLNSVSIQRETFADLDINGKVKLGPALNYSNQFTADTKFEFGSLAFYLSYIKDSPDLIRAEVNQAVQTLSDLEGREVTLELNKLNWHELEQSVYISYADISNGLIQDLNADGSPNIVTFAKYRQQYFKPLKLGAKNLFYLGLKHPIATDLQYIYDSVQKGSLASFNAKYALLNNQQLILNIGFDILGAQTTAEENSEYYLSKFQANDRLFGGLQYVF